MLIDLKVIEQYTIDDSGSDELTFIDQIIDWLSIFWKWPITLQKKYLSYVFEPCDFNDHNSFFSDRPIIDYRLIDQLFVCFKKWSRVSFIDLKVIVCHAIDNSNLAELNCID